MFNQQCRICGCEWTATKPNLPCPNCRSLEPLHGEPFPLQGEEARKFATFYRRMVFNEDRPSMKFFCTRCHYFWEGTLSLDTKCPNCGRPRPFLDYEPIAPEWLRKPIYDAPISERLTDVAQAVQMAQNMVDMPQMAVPTFENSEGLKEGEFAIGNWIVRPRFK